MDLENSDYIMKSINDSKSTIEAKLNALGSNATKCELEMCFKELNTEYERLNKFVNDSALYLAKYNLKLSQTIVNNIRKRIDEKRDSLIPKSKFSFKTTFKPKVNVSLKPKSEAIDEFDSSNAAIDSIPFLGFKDIRDAEKALRMSAEESSGKDIQLTGLSNCEIQVFGAPNALKVNRLSNCRLFCGPITTSALISDCTDCVFRTASQQLRIHSSTHCDLYLHVTSRAIIEDSTRIRFAAYDWTYDGINDDFKSANLDINANNWRQIDDFDCLTVKQSTNWSFV